MGWWVDLVMTRNIPLLLFFGLVWGQTFSFKIEMKDTTNIDADMNDVRKLGYNHRRSFLGVDSLLLITSIGMRKIYPNESLKLNGQKYTLIRSDFRNQRLILRREVTDPPLAFFREPVDGLLFPWNIIKFPIYNLLTKKKIVQQDTMSFDSINSFVSYEKSKDSFRSYVLKGAKYGALQGLVLGSLIVANDINKHGGSSKSEELLNGGLVTSLMVIYAGALGAINGCVHGILLPKASKEHKVGDGKWYIDF